MNRKVWTCLLAGGLVGMGGYARAQNAAGGVSGIVKNEANEVVSGTTISLESAATHFSASTMANVQGLFGFSNVPVGTGYTFIISAMGYESDTLRGYTIRENGKVTLAITLKGKSNQLSQVVVVGYGVSSKRNLTSAIASVSANDLNKGVYSDPVQMIQGKVAGLSIARNGDPNGAATLVLRGASTLRDGANAPLVVVDGVPGADLTTIAADDIASMDVLKDAAATAIYGNRGANGIIMVSTKRAKKGQARIGYNGYVSMDKVSNRIDMMTGDQLRDFLTKNNMSLAAVDDKGANTDWQKAIQRNGAISQNHNLSIGGGTENTLYTASLNYFKQEGILKNSSVERVTGRLSIEQNALDDNLKLGFNVINTVNMANRIPFQNAILGQALKFLPTVPVKDASGVYSENTNHTGYYNPVGMLENVSDQFQTQSLIANATAMLKLPAGFSYNLSASYRSSQYEDKAYYTSYFTNTYSYAQSTLGFGGKNGEAYRSSYRDNSKILETFLNYDKKFGRHTIKALVGYSWQKDITGDGFQASNTNFSSDDLSFYWLGWGNTPTSYAIKWGANYYRAKTLVSDFGRVNYSYADKYLLQVSLRHDGSSVFGANNRWGIFPSVSAGWRITGEKFMTGQKLFNDLKLRAGYGVTGNSSGIDALTPLQTYGSSGSQYFYYNGAWITPIGITQNANPNLKWEKTATLNAGLDFAILKNRVSGSVEVYRKTTSDLIWNYPVSTTQYAVSSITANAGKMRNSGIELTLNAAAIVHKNFSWNTSLNLSHNSNVLVSLSNNIYKLDSITTAKPNGSGQTDASVQLLKAGHPVGQFFTYEYAGKTSDGRSQFYDSKGVAQSDNSKLSSADYRYAGSAQPKLVLGWTNNIRYHNFDFSVLFRSVLGNKIFNVTKADLYRPSTSTWYNLPVSAAGESVKDDNDYRYSTRFIENGSYLRLDNATLGYTFKNPAKYLQSIRCYASVNNLFVITSYTGIDPEVEIGGLTPGIDNNNFYPKTRSFLVGINVSL